MTEEIKPNDQFDLDDLPASGKASENLGLSKIIKAAIALFILIALAGIGIYFWQQQKNKSDPSKVLITTPIPTTIATPEPTSNTTPKPEDSAPIATATPVPLPELNESDDAISTYLKELSESLLSLTTKDEIARKFVRAIYGLSQGNVVQQYRPINGPNTSIEALETKEITKVKTKKGAVDTPVYQLTQQDFNRYALYANLAQQLPVDKLSRIYKYFYPLLQKAHGELGEGPEQFHATMIGALDKLIATPNIEDNELKLVRTSIIYQFKEQNLESLPAAQKMLLRMGAENRTAIQQTMNALRDALAEFSP